MKIFLGNYHYYISPLFTETDDKTILEIYNVVFNSKDQVKEINNLYKKTRDPKFFQKLLLLLTGLQFEEETARSIWEEIERYHKDITKSLGRNIHISATIADYMLKVKHYLKNPGVFDLVLTEKIKNASLQDFLTGLYKGYFFEDFLRREINRSKRHNHKFSVIMFQVNGMENVSLSGNISVATKILVDIATIIKHSKRSEDISFKFSISKFGIILPHTDKKGAMLFAKRLLTDITNSVLNISGVIFGISLSVGVQTFPDDAQDLQTLVSNVEKACYKAKIMGNNKIVYEL